MFVLVHLSSKSVALVSHSGEEPLSQGISEPRATVIYCGRTDTQVLQIIAEVPSVSFRSLAHYLSWSIAENTL